MPLHSFERKPPPMFRRSLSPSARMGLVAVATLVLMVVDSRWRVGAGVRTGVATVLQPFQWLSAQPVKAVDLMGSYVTTVETAQQTKEQATLQIAQQALKDFPRCCRLQMQTQWRSVFAPPTPQPEGL